MQKQLYKLQCAIIFYYINLIINLLSQVVVTSMEWKWKWQLECRTQLKIGTRHFENVGSYFDLSCNQSRRKSDRKFIVFAESHQLEVILTNNNGLKQLLKCEKVSSCNIHHFFINWSLSIKTMIILTYFSFRIFFIMRRNKQQLR